MAYRVCEGQQKVVLGAPGCGKTTKLLTLMDEEMASGVPPGRVAYVSFTRKAVDEAKSRAIRKFDVDSRELPYFRTNHSLGFHLMGATSKAMIRPTDYEEIGKLLGVRFSDNQDSPARSVGDEMLFLDSLARVQRKALEDVYRGYRTFDFTFQQFEQFHSTLREYKGDTGMIDFTDLLEETIQSGAHVDVDVAFVDEGQDLSPIQWEMLRAVFRGAQRVYVAGDDDQAIYRWSGADVDTFQDLVGEKVVLSQSHRLPRAVHGLAEKVISRVRHRYEKRYSPKDEDGSVEYHHTFDQVEIDPSEEWLILARNVDQMWRIERDLKERGLTFVGRYDKRSVTQDSIVAIKAWEKLRKGGEILGKELKTISQYMVDKAVSILPDTAYTAATVMTLFSVASLPVWYDAFNAMPTTEKAYYRTVLARGGQSYLLADPKIHVSTIHGVKGGESDNVVLMSDMSSKTYDSYMRNPEDEHRVFYVGITRSKRSLHVVMPQTTRYYPLT